MKKNEFAILPTTSQPKAVIPSYVCIQNIFICFNVSAAVFVALYGAGVFIYFIFSRLIFLLF